ncbi:multicopper oxidase domain-containing protein [Microbacterium sp. SY138]|uniref:multicopper oxidase domain-containing protein n=1 Tax=unclassified Microbacterium TaxID=2609290 RepID=UPI00321AFF76
MVEDSTVDVLSDVADCQHTDGGPRQDTSIVLPGQTLTVDFDADNPGQWLAHCHNIYHGESGMMGVIGYEE